MLSETPSKACTLSEIPPKTYMLSEIPTKIYMLSEIPTKTYMLSRIIFMVPPGLAISPPIKISTSTTPPPIILASDLTIARLEGPGPLNTKITRRLSQLWKQDIIPKVSVRAFRGIQLGSGKVRQKCTR